MLKFRDLKASEIDCRIQSVHKEEKGLILLLYKDARVDQNILDETVGAEFWQREHYECKGNLFCRVGIYVPLVSRAADGKPTPESPLEWGWVWKADCGTESNTEAQKGEASDSFKRACFNWGIGRELYTSPFIWIPKDKCNIKNGKCYDKFVVERIVIEDKQIVALSIQNLDIKTEKGNPIRAFIWQQPKGE